MHEFGQLKITLKDTLKGKKDYNILPRVELNKPTF